MKLLALLQTKAAITVLAGVLLVGGGTAAFAATPSGQTVVHSIVHTSAPTVTAHGTPKDEQGTPDKDHATCPGLADAQNLATSYGLDTSSTGAAVTAICALHEGTFQGTTTTGTNVTTSRVYGYGEIDQLLTYAQYLATKDSANTDGTLSDTNVTGYLANALQSCGSTPLESCLKTNIPDYQPGNSNGNKPAETPTPHDNKPTSTSTPTPHGNKPTGTPTPHN